MDKKLSYDVKELMVELAGACFWFWKGFDSFLDSCGVPKSIQGKYSREVYPSKYAVMRALLSDLEQVGRTDLIEAIASGFYKLKGPRDRDHLDVPKALRLLSEFRDALGDDPIDAEIRRREKEQAKAAHQDSQQQRQAQHRKLDELNSEFLALTMLSGVTEQERGFKLEKLLFNLLSLCEIEHSPPYRTPGKEQIDGHFRHEKFDYLVEVKWTSGPTKQPDLSIFDGKIRGKAQSTRGFFLSADGFDDVAVQKYSGDSPRIILMTGEDLALVLSGRVSLADALKAKVDAIVRHGVILFPVRSFAT